MKVIRATQQMLETRTLVLGFQGENLRTQLRVDCSPTFAEYSNATPALAIKPPSGETYPVFVERDGTEVVWDIVANNLILKGDGELQLTFYKDNVIAKTSVGHIRVNRSLQIDGEMPDVVATWIENANRKLAEVDAQIVELEGMVDTATDAATRAEQSASTASIKAEQAAGSAATATEKATEATNAAGTATAKAAEAEQSALTATDKANAAAESERIATAKAGDAITAAGTATAKAEQATEAAQTATEKAGDASASARAAQASATNAASSATAAQAAQTTARASETAAGTSATQAAQSAQNANTAAQTAEQKAGEAATSATNAATSATNAATSAETASTKAGEAAQSAQAVEETAEQLAESLEQIAQNTQDIAELDERKANIDGYYPDMTVGNAEQLNSSKFVENSEPYTLRTSGGTSDIGNREYLDAVVGGTVAWNQAVRDEASENSTDFAPIVTVTDAVEDAAGVKVKIEPVQDLHGYDHPWPAGGGVNIFNKDASGKTANAFINYSTGGYGGSGDYYATDYIPVNPQINNSVVISGNTGGYIGGSVGMACYDSSKVYVRGSSTTTMDITGAAYIRLSVPTASENTFQCEYGTTASSYAPYSNICPITGFDSVQVWNDPAHGGLIEWNQLIRNGNFSNGIVDWDVYSGTGSVNDGVLAVTGAIGRHGVRGSTNMTSKINHKYFCGVSYISTAQIEFNFIQLPRVYGEPTNELTRIETILSCSADNVTFRTDIFPRTKNEVCDFSISNVVLFDLTQMFGETKADEIYAMEQAEAGSGVAYVKSLFPADYYPYNAGEITTVSAVNGDPYRHYSITLPTEAGTVYGGKLTVNADGSGSLVVDRAMLRLNTANMNNNNEYPGWRDLAELPGIVGARVNTPVSATLNIGGSAVGANTTAVTSGILYLPVGIYKKTQDEWKALAMDIEILLHYATPITYTLTASQIRTLLGENNIWADTGDLALTYTGTDEHLTLESGKKYLARLSGTDSMLLGSGQEITAAKGTDNVFDLTQMFGTAVADYVYGQGAAFFRKWFGSSHYSYNAGELLSVDGLQSHDMVGFNAWDEEWEIGRYNPQTGEKESQNTTIRSTNYIHVLPNTSYYTRFPNTIVVGNLNFCYYDADKNFISFASNQNNPKTTPANASYMTFYIDSKYGTTYKHDICISLAHNGSRNGEYEPYEKHSYPLDSLVILRGIPKVGANGVYWDGDRYLPDGTISRGWMEYTFTGNENISDWLTGVYGNRVGLTLPTGALRPEESQRLEMVAVGYTPSSLLNSNTMQPGQCMLYPVPANRVSVFFCVPKNFDTQESARTYVAGTKVLVRVATPTTETAQPYHSTQWVSDWGTEEFVSTGLVPVGHETRYPANLRDKLQHLPDAASGNGSYLITQTDGQMVLTPFPAPPSSAGNYVLKATVVNGVATYTWEVAT